MKDRLTELYFKVHPTHDASDLHMYYNMFNLGIIVENPKYPGEAQNFWNEEYELACSILESKLYDRNI